MRLLLLLLFAAFPCVILHADEWLPGYTNNGPWVKDQLAAQVADAKAIDGTKVQLVFLGDSITCFWRNHAPLWTQTFAQWTPLNLGIGADNTEHMRWRLANGPQNGLEPAGLDPRAVVLMAGTNNLGGTPEARAEGVRLLLVDVQHRWPKAVVLLMSITPRGHGPGDAMYDGNQATNPLLKKLADDQRVIWIDLASQMTWDGQKAKGIGGDFVHFNDEGYQMWVDSILGTLQQIMQEDPSKLAPRFAKPATVPKIARLEESIAAGRVGAGEKNLETLANDKDAATADAAKASLAIITAWKAGIDAEIAKSRDDGDVFLAAELAGCIETSYTGEIAKSYHDQVVGLKKDPAYPAGREYKKLAAIPFDLRQDPQFKKLVDAFLKKYPNGFYAKQAQALIPAK